MRFPDTQLQAWDSIQEKLPESRKAVLKIISSAGSYGISTIAVSEKLGWPINCISGRITELKKVGVVKDSGRRCVNPSGKKGILWVIASNLIHFDHSGQGVLI